VKSRAACCWLPVCEWHTIAAQAFSAVLLLPHLHPMATKQADKEPAHSQRIAYSYRRVSSAGQATEQRDGLRRQEDELRRFALEHGLTVAEELVDAGVSSFRGTNRRDGALSRFVEAARAGKVPPGAVLVVEDLDRFSREHPVDSFMALLKDVIGAGFGLGITRWDRIITKENFSSEGFGYRLLGAAEGAHEHSAKLSDRIGAYYQEKRRLALEEGTPNSSKAARPYWLDFEGGEFVPNRHAEMIRTIFRLAADFGSVKISKMLEEMGFRTAVKGTPMRHHQVINTLNNRQVLGEKAHCTRLGELLHTQPGYFPAIVTQEEWELAHQKMAQRRMSQANTATRRIHNLFQGRVFCAACLSLCGMGQKYANLASGERKHYKYLRCKEHDGGRCDRANFTYDEEDLLRRIAAFKWAAFLSDPNHDAALVKGRDAVLAAEDQLGLVSGQLQRVKDNITRALTGEIDNRALGDLYDAKDRLALDFGTADAAANSAKLEYKRLQMKPSGLAAERAIRARVEQFLQEDRHDVDTRHRFNAWLHEQRLLMVIDAKDGTVDFAWGESVLYRDRLGRSILDSTIEDAIGLGMDAAGIAALRAEMRRNMGQG